jgi:ubiquinone/menaquinone biosynthesis C-methylase UbiE
LAITVNDTATRRAKPEKPGFEQLYLAVRQQEKRIYTDEQLKNLPDIAPAHPYYNEWLIRKQSSDRLIDYLKKNKKKHLKILEVGCGNGWLSAALSSQLNARVTGIDNNRVEITQAKRVFANRNIDFIYSSFNDDTFSDEKFDVIIFAASLQYFPSLITILKQSLAILNRGGEIHIIDSHFYKPTSTDKAEERSRQYYAGLGFPEMNKHYFHHSVSEFWGFKYNILFNPDSLLNRLLKKGPFYWIVVYK